jgi:hypothetical protein
MKPLPAAPLAGHDEAIFKDRFRRRSMRWDIWIEQRGMEGDRRDAELMYQAQRDRSFGVIGYMPTLAKVPHDPFPYTGGVKLGYLARWRAECMLDVYDET